MRGRKRVTGVLWSRHANQWSVWMLVAAYPLLLFAIYRRSARQLIATALLVPLGVLPFRPARDDRAWATRVVLGEQVWMEHGSLRSPEGALIALSTPVHLLTIRAALRRSGITLVLGAALSMAAMLAFFSRMATFYDEHQRSEP